MKYSRNKYYKIVLLLSIIIISIFTFLFIKIYMSAKNDYKIRYDTLSYNTDMLNYTILYNEFFSDSFRYPYNTKEIEEYYAGSIRFEQVQEKMKDPFSKQCKDFYYIPVFSKFNNMCEGYLLISAGIDGEIDTHINDTVFFENVKELKFYNPIKESKYLSYQEYEFNFSLKDYLYGNKDLLIEYANGIDIFINNAKQRVFSPTMLMEKLYPRGFSKLDCSVQGKVKRKNDNTLIVFDSNSSVICNMYEGRKAVFEDSGFIKIAGKYRNKIDPIEREVYLDNCIVLD